MKIASYNSALEYLKGKKDRPFAHNTRIILPVVNRELGHEVITATYHNNPVVNFFPEFNTYSSCGWKTITTKERINWFLPDGFSCYQEKSVWYISDRQLQKSYVFADGICINPVTREVWNAGEQDNTKDLLKKIKKYVNGYILALVSGKIEKPSGGDCWYCYMHTDDGQSLGDKTGNVDHIMSHFEESYFVPSMLYNAYNFKPSRLSDFAKDGIARLTSGMEISDWQRSIVARDVKSILTDYLKHVLNLAH